MKQIKTTDTRQDAINAVTEAMKEIGRIYSDEEEWRAKENSLKIPLGSELYFIIPAIDREEFSKYLNKELNSLELWGKKYSLEIMVRTLDAINKYRLSSLYDLYFIKNTDLDRNRKNLNYNYIQQHCSKNPFISER